MGTQTAMLCHSEEVVVLDYDGTNWTTGTNSPESIANGGAAGTNTAAFVFSNNDSQTWNGTAWTTVADMNVERQEQGGCGSVTAALAGGGEISPAPAFKQTEEWSDPNLVTATFTSS